MSSDPEVALPASAYAPLVRARSLAVRVFLIAFALSFLLEAAWTYATPLLAAPDEPVQLVKSAAVARGELLGNLADGPQSPQALVQVPAFYALLRWPAADPAHSQICFHSKPTVAASCAASVNTPASLEAVKEAANREAWIYNARYPPLYYAIVGLASLTGQGSWAVYLMRLASALVSSLFLALAATVCLAWSENRLLRLGFLVAVTPMALFLGGVVNPSGLEISSGIACWSSVLVLVTENSSRASRALSFVAAGSAAVFVSTRGLSPFWLVLIALCCALSATPGRLFELFREPRIQLLSAAVAAVGVLAVVWILKEHATLVYSSVAQVPPQGLSELTILKTSFHHNVYYLPGMIGIFGWFDTRSPFFTFVLWYAMAIGMTVLGLRSGTWRRRLDIVVIAVGILVVPVLISSSQVRAHGYIWTGRDTLPFAVGLPLVAACAAGLSDRARGRTRNRRLPSLFAVAAFVALAGAFYEAERRYAVGTLGSVKTFLWHHEWQPVTGLVLPLVAELVASAVALVLLVRVRPPHLGGWFQSGPTPEHGLTPEVGDGHAEDGLHN